jgi:mono/diheme cytochrome c family protein
VVAAGLVAAGCGASEPATSIATTASTAPIEVTTRRVDTVGRELFEERVIGVNGGCITCHSLEEGASLVGPSLFHVTSRVPGMSDADYIRQSIVDPDAYIVDGYDSGQMPGDWAQVLSEEQIESLVDYLLQ